MVNRLTTPELARRIQSSASPEWTPRNVLSLNDSAWAVGWVLQQPFDDFDAVHEWLPATVPGDVRLDMLRAGKISDPFYGTNNERSQWIDGRDWRYRREIDVPRESGARAFVVFDGIDYQSAVYANRVRLGRHVGMFSRQVYELPREGRIVLAVRVWGADALPKLVLTRAQQIWARLISPLLTPPNRAYPDRYATLKCQMQFGWDFAPRLRTSGIWDDAYIVITRSVLIRDVWLRAESNPPAARVHCAVTLDSDREQPAKLFFRIRGRNRPADELEYQVDCRLAAGTQTQEVELDIPDARAWDPWDRGEPNLYDVQVTVVGPDADVPSDSVTSTFGVRSVQLAATGRRDAEPWTLIVNGKREFIRGANWVPLDAIPGRVTREDYAARLAQVRAANVNFLRVWGGGLREKHAFYDLCDEMGILVWQEFPFAGAVLDRFPSDAAFLAFAGEEAGAIVRMLRNHPSLVVWCGGNEFNTRGNRAVVQTLAQAVAREDGTRPFKPASPYRDESHNWRIWHRSANLRDYCKDETPFLSEFGLQSVPGVESLDAFLPRASQFPPNALWEYHHAQLGKLRRYARGVNARADETLAAFVDATQRAQAMGLQIAIEHMRRRKGSTAGVAVWQFNDAWPAISWSVVDYYGRPKLAYSALKRLYSPLLVSYRYDLAPAGRRRDGIVHGDLWLINDLLESYADLELCATFHGERVWERTVTTLPDSTTRLGALDLLLGAGENVLEIELRQGETVFSANEYDLNYCDAGEISPLFSILYPIYDRLMR